MIVKYYKAIIQVRSSDFFLNFISCGWVGSPLLCVGRGQSSWPSHDSDFFSCGAWTLGAWASAVMAHGLSCPSACGLLLDQGLNLCFLHSQGGS